MAGKYLIVFRGLRTVVPASLREFVKKKVSDEFASFDVELDFSGTRAKRDLLVKFVDEVPGWPVFGESFRMTINGVAQTGDSTVFVRAMKMMRLKTSASACEAAFPETEDSLGTVIANVTIHETGHMLGMDTGGHDDGGHTSDPANYMWDPGTMPGGDTHVGLFFEYTVQRGDTLSGIVRRYVQGKLNSCRVGSNDLKWIDVWRHPANKEMGFVAHPKKSGVAGRRLNDPNWIYPGEKVALPNDNLRTQAYRLKVEGFLKKKSFTKDQIDTMTTFIAARLAAGKG
jgi:hypothetical protein